jgi:hypothetical protein
LNQVIQKQKTSTANMAMPPANSDVMHFEDDEAELEAELEAMMQWWIDQRMEAAQPEGQADPEINAIQRWEMYKDLAESGEYDSIVECMFDLEHDLNMVRAFDEYFDGEEAYCDLGTKEDVVDRFRLVVREMEEKGCVSREDYIRWVQQLQICVVDTDSESDSWHRESRECVICTEEMVEGGLCECINCGNLFHEHCMREWALTGTTCPLCRGTIHMVIQQPQYPAHTW